MTADEKREIEEIVNKTIANRLGNDKDFKTVIANLTGHQRIDILKGVARALEDLDIRVRKLE